MLKNRLKSKNLILASGSPRRQELLKSLGVPFEIRLKEINENYPKQLKNSAISDYLAKHKSNAFSKKLIQMTSSLLATLSFGTKTQH